MYKQANIFGAEETVGTPEKKRDYEGFKNLYINVKSLYQACDGNVDGSVDPNTFMRLGYINIKNYIPSEWIEEYLKKWITEPNTYKFRNFVEEMIIAWRKENE